MNQCSSTISLLLKSKRHCCHHHRPLVFVNWTMRKANDTVFKFEPVVHNSHGTPKTPMPRPLLQPPSAPNPFQIYFDELGELPPKDITKRKDDKEKPGHVLVHRGGRLVSEEMDVEELHISMAASKKQRLNDEVEIGIDECGKAVDAVVPIKTMPCWTCSKSGEIEIIVAMPGNFYLERRACGCCNGNGERIPLNFAWIPPPPTTP